MPENRSSLDFEPIKDPTEEEKNRKPINGVKEFYRQGYKYKVSDSETIDFAVCFLRIIARQAETSKNEQDEVIGTQNNYWAVGEVIRKGGEKMTERKVNIY